ncbi:TniB family NTP-binding protein [Halopseudomonas bauzanensis]|uniref:TniB family NTP-binding protein n=1 Tax=Halopseudomonas bauzanensis TaxID=653930 RepID=UPI003525BD94
MMSPYLRNTVIYHDRFDEVLKQIEQLWQRTLTGDKQILPIAGPTRLGKSAVIAEYLRTRPSTLGSQPVLYIVAPEHHTARALPDACLTSIGMNCSMYRNGSAATSAFLKAIKRLGTKLIIFDETQHLLERSGQRTIRGAGDFLKGLLDSSDVSIVLAGLPALEGLFSANEQLAGRARSTVRFFPYSWHGQEYKSFRKALAGAIEMLGEHGWDMPDAKDADFAMRMYVATAGCYGLVHKILCEVEALKTDEQVAAYGAFAEAYETAIRRRAVTFNPFDADFSIEAEHMAAAYIQVLREAGITDRGLAKC